MLSRRKALLAGAATLCGGAVAGCASGSGTPGLRSTVPGDQEASGSSIAGPGSFPIICLEEHVHDVQVAASVREAFSGQVPYLGGLGSRYRDDPGQHPADRPRLTFVPDSMKLAARPLPDRLMAMDAAAIDHQVVSISNATQLAPVGEAADLARGANDRLAEAVAAHPDRFSAYFTLPWQDPDAAVLEAERCVKELNLSATLLSGRPSQDHFLDDRRYDLVLEKLADLGAPLFLHPGPPIEAVRLPYYSGFNADLEARFSLFGWGWHHEAGIHVVRLILSGALDRHPGLKIISGHWGEMVPFWLQRLDDTMPPEVTGLNRTISRTYRDQIWIGPSGMLDTPHFNFVREVVGIDRIIFSVDYPYLTMTGARAWLESLNIPQWEKEAIAFRNAQALLRLK